MKFNIYDFNDNIKIVDTKDRDVERIIVDVVSGDEVVYIEYKDGGAEKRDSSHDRFINYYDGHYTLSGDRLAEWLNFKAREGEVAISYNRLEMFGTEED